MAASRYRRFLRLCEEWPVEESKRQRDLGAALRLRVAQAFREGDNTQVGGWRRGRAGRGLGRAGASAAPGAAGAGRAGLTFFQRGLRRVWC